MAAEGMNDCQIARATGISRTTIREWRTLGPPGTRGGTAAVCPRCEGADLDEPAYEYLLGLYLGDGYISRDPRTYRLRVFQDQRYIHLIRLGQDTISRVRPRGSRASLVREVGCVAISSCWNHWPCLFPQHGPGTKHERPIVLEGWQRAIVDRCPRQLIRGLIHSDGCRVMNRVWKGRYAYPRYLFTNTSGDILQIFRDACDRAGIPHRDSKTNTISIARRDGVQALDAFIGPKC
jgi:hypothetical protein